MKTFIVTNDCYMVETPDIEIREAEDIRDLLINQMGIIYDRESLEVEKLSDEDMWKAFDNVNGDGQPFYVIKELVIEEGRPKLKAVRKEVE